MNPRSRLSQTLTAVSRHCPRPWRVIVSKLPVIRVPTVLVELSCYFLFQLELVCERE